MQKTSFFLLLAFLILYAACRKDEITETQVSIRLTDGPGDYEQVNIDLLEIRVKTAKDTAKWITLTTKKGIYDLLKFQNGLDTMIASGVVPLAVLKEVRFVLGGQNTVKVDGVIFPLETPSAQSSGLKVKIDKDLALHSNTFVLDFDANASIKKSSPNGNYKLQPVIKLK